MKLSRLSLFKHELNVKVLGVCLFLSTIIQVTTVYAQNNPLIFRDDFNRSELGNDWGQAEGWSIQSGYAYNNTNGIGGILQTADKYSAPSYILETTARGFSSSYQREFRIVFGQKDQNQDSAYVL